MVDVRDGNWLMIDPGKVLGGGGRLVVGGGQEGELPVSAPRVSFVFYEVVVVVVYSRLNLWTAFCRDARKSPDWVLLVRG